MPMHKGLKLPLLQNFSSVAFMCVFHHFDFTAEIHEVLFCSHKNFISTRHLSSETLCQKIHFMYYRQPLREYSCVINFHFKANSSWNDVREWGFEVVRIQIEAKKIKNK